MILLLFLFLLPSVSSTDCCTLPSESLQWLSYSHPPCFHPGQPLLQLPSSPCVTPLIESPLISLHQDVVYAESRLCLYDRPLVLSYNTSCDGGTNWRQRWLRLAHPRESTRRVKRWLRRRNPTASIIHFQQERYVKELAEDVETGEHVLTVKATHVSQQPIYYSMVAPQDSRSANIFTLDTVTGEIRLAKSLDRETLDKHVLKVTAYERLNPSVSASSTVVIDVLDVQDNSPVFERDSYFAETREDAPVGTTVLSVFARDLDSGLNGEIEYLLDEEGEGVHLLKVHPKLGVVQTAAPLDRETLPVMRLSVIARDKGDPPRQSTALIQLTLIDVNDNSPIFDQEVYNVSVLENTTLPAVIAVVSAKDADIGVNGEVHYSLASSTSLPVTVDYSTGEVSLRSALPLSDTPFSLLVRAKDGSQPAKSTTVPLYIHVIDINDNAPVFVAAQRQLFIEEGVALGEKIGRVLAIDQDVGDNAKIKYTLNGTEDIEIDGETGIIRTTTNIDRERTARYDVIVTATDGGDPPLSNSTQMTIIVKDVNDNTPVFEKDHIKVSLSEDSPLGSKVALLKATDADEDSKLIYRIEKTTADVFSLIDLGSEGGLLSLASPLRLAGKDEIRVHVAAIDEGGLKGTTVVEIVINDVNSAPVFIAQPFSVHIPEDSPIGASVLAMKAEDSDRGDNAIVKYSLCEDCAREFEINETTGLITVAMELDRETRNSYMITVTASDSADHPLSTSTTLEIILDDVNDNAPRFTSQNYSAAISEDIAIGTSFLQVSASDSDEGENSLIDYYLNESSSIVQLDLFRLDRTSGTLRVNAKIDRETMEHIHLPIYARDRGKPSLSSSSLISIKLSDVNDNAPKFEQSHYELSLAENSPAGTIVGTITATDADDGDNAKIEFRIFGGSDARFFDIVVDEDEPNAVKILSRIPFDYEAKTNTFHVEIQALSGQLSSTAVVRIRLSDVNDNRPQLKDFVVYVVSHEERPANGDIGSIPAFDADQSASLEYSLSENELMGVDTTNGRLSLKREWRGNVDTRLKACVSDGPNTVCSQCRLIFVFVRSVWMDDALSVRLDGINEDSFWDPNVFGRFRQSLSTLSDWHESDVFPLSVHSSQSKSLDVSFIVRNRQRIVKWWKVRDLLESERSRVERLAMVGISWTDEEACRKEPCPYYQQCRNTLKFVEEAHKHETDNFISHSLQTLKSFTCQCPQGFTTTTNSSGQCDARLDLCFNSPCSNNASCIGLENGVRCECRPGWRGKYCEIPERTLSCLPGYCRSASKCMLREGRMHCVECPFDVEDSDNRCTLRSVSFDGKGIVRVEEQLGRVQWNLQLRIATIAHDGVLVFAGDRSSDFFELSIEGRLLRAEYSVGGERSKVVKMKDDKRNRVNDGEWHTITVEYYQRHLRLSLDSCDGVLSGKENSLSCSSEGIIDLPSKCFDASLPCFRFLDVVSGLFIGGRPTKGREIERSFNGCVSNLTLDGTLVDFSNGDETERIGIVHDGCPSRRNGCDERTCEGRCKQKWKGGQCVGCHGKGCHGEHHRALSLFDEESFVAWKPDDSTPSPFDISFSFRTIRNFGQLLVVEMDTRSLFLVIHVEDGLIRASFGTNSTTLQSPELNSVHWTKISIEFREENIVIAVDDLYTTMMSLPHEVRLSVIYSGLAPSTNHPSQFEGCIRGMIVNGEELDPFQQGKIRHGCSSHNRCSIDGVCPPNSRCVREGDKHRCECHPGFFGDSCRPSCSLNGICGLKGLCQPSNNTRGYDCECPQDRGGLNCEWNRPLRMCPRGWYGGFPHCKECDCDQRKGFIQQCHQSTGKCMCPKDHFLSNGRCIVCGCGQSSSSTSCSSNGQCQCTGESRGLKCDRCLSPFSLLDVSKSKCSSLKGSCPAQIEDGIAWPTTRKNIDARVACPSPQTGVATRRCGSDSLWKEIQRFNCTIPTFNDLLSKVSSASSSEMISHLNNVTVDEYLLEGRNLLIAHEALMKLIDHTKDSVLKETAGDNDQLESLIHSASAIISRSPPIHFLFDLRRILNFGKSLVNLSTKMDFLPPMQICSNNLLFSLNDVSASDVLPKFDTFLDLRPDEFPDVRLMIGQTERTRTFYFMTPPLNCPQCHSAIVGVSSSSSSIRVAFPMNNDGGWTYPECVSLSPGKEGWTPMGSSLISLNSSHALCQFSKGEGLFTVISSQQHNSFLRLSHSTPLSSLTMCGVSVAFIVLSIFITICRSSIPTRLIRIGFSLSLILESIVIFSLHKVAVNDVFCPVRNALLSFSTFSPFAWLFLYSLHIYLLLAHGRNDSNPFMCLLIGVVFPSIFSSISFFLTSSCTLSWSGWLLWFLIIPISLFLLFTFCSSCTSLLLSGDKQYQLFVVGHRLRRALLQHAILYVMTLGYTIVGVFLSSSLNPYGDIISNCLLLLLSIATLLWSYTLSGNKNDSSSPIYGAKSTLWMGEDKRNEVEGQCASPLMGEDERGWMPDVIPATSSSSDRSHPSILSPATKILNDVGAPPVYASQTLARLTTAEDSLDDAYYTYTRKYHASTFSRR